MAEPDSFNKPHLLVPDPTSPIKPKPSKSYSAFLCKSLFVALLLVLLPLFPSQAPEFINQTILTKFWELLHLLFIGVVVSYGLFGRKNTEMNSEIQSKLDDSQTYLSGILYVPSIFEDGCENPFGFDEKRTIQACNPSELLNNGIGNSVLDELNNPRSFNFHNGLENPSGSDEKKRMSQAWNSQYCFQGESVVFVSRENCVLDEWGKPKSINDNKPLSLPVRSLRSTIVDHDTIESVKENGSSPDSKGSCKNSENFRDGTRNRDLNPINLDEKLRETVKPPSHSRSNRMEVREDHMSSVKPPTHSRPLSVGGFEFDHLKSESFWSPIFSQTSSIPSPPKKVSPEAPKSKTEDLEREKNSGCWSSLQDLQSASIPRNGEALLLASNARRFSIGSLSEMNVQRDCDDKLKDFSKSMREDTLGNGKLGVDSFKTEVKSLRRGKSVRTIRASEHCLETTKMVDNFPDHVDDKAGKTCDKFEAMSMENKGRRAELEQLPENTKKQNLDDLSLEQSSKLSNCAETNAVESEKDSDSEFEKFQVSSDEEEEEEEKEEEVAAQPDIVDDAELDPDEVDRKAGEFIAKFREQIRLQRIASVKEYMVGRCTQKR